MGRIRFFLASVLMAAMASTASAQSNVTGKYVTNAGFDDETFVNGAPNGWTLDVSSSLTTNKVSTGAKGDGLISADQNHWQLYQWKGAIKGKAYQKKTGLPDGTYKLTVAVSSSFSGIVNLYLNDPKKAIESGQPKVYEVETLVTGGTLEFGLQLDVNGSRQTIDFDSFNLYHKEAGTKWWGNALDDVLASSKDETATKPKVSDADRSNPKKTVFLYNTLTGKFLNQGSWWGTHTIVNDVGIKCWILKKQVTVNGQAVDRYYIETACKNSQFSYKDDYLGFSGNEPYLDNGEGQWMIDPIAEGSSVYYIHSTQHPNISDSYLFVDSDNKYVRTAALNDDLTGNGSRAKWILVTQQDLMGEFQKTTVQLKGVPADATFMLGDPDFHRYSIEQVQWKFEPPTSGTSATLFVGINKHYQKYDVTKNEYAWVVSGDTNGGDSKHGCYWSARIIGGKGTMYQELSINKSGWYQIQCQGECYVPNGASYNVASLFAKTDAVKITSPIRTVASKIGEFSKTDIGSNSEAERYYKSYGDYTNTLMIYVDCGTDNSKVATLTLGIKVDGENVPAETGVAVDAFRLQYCGLPDGHNLVLDEDFTNFDYITKETGDKQYNNSILYLHRLLTKKMWNTIILPVDLTADQFNTTFGIDAKLARYNGVRNNRLQFLVQDDKSIYDTEEKGAFLKANMPYIIWPTIEPEHTAAYTYTTTLDEDTNTRELNAFDVTVGTPYYVVNNVSMDKANVNQNVINASVDAETLKDGYAFHGILTQDYEGKTFLDGAHVKAGDYTFNQGKLHLFKGDYGMKGFRCWFHAVDGGVSQAKWMGVEINGISGNEVTGVDAPWNDEMNDKMDVYTINGQKVNVQRLEDLPRGIYVVNHKKYVVR